MATVKTEYRLDTKKLGQFLRNVRQEIKNIQSGEPKWRTGPPLHFETDKAVPIFAVLERFEQSPTKATYDAFIAQATQDLGKPTGDGFATWGQGLFVEVTSKGEDVKVSKTFEAAIKDGFYDCFKVAQIGMTQQQVDRLQEAANRIAKAFLVEIHSSIKDQLTTLVAKLKAEEAKSNDD